MYQEHQPSPRLRPWVECLWTSQTVQAVSQGRVFPDGCVDIIYFRETGSAQLRAVGAMTRVHTVDSPPDFLAVGVRFRPGAGKAFLGLPLGETTDESIPLEDLWSVRARRWNERLSDCYSISELIAAVESALEPPEDIMPARQALFSLARNGGLWGPDELARQCGLSARHFRRVCVDETGLTPKRLSRILRFRRALSRIRSPHQNGGPIDYARLAVEGGYYDQAHLIRDFQEFAGATPRALFRPHRP